ncbi:hypothetical protein [uncultured Mediterranean phage uvDeep-CGR2-KM21-C368]|nr:hypothetical protein [uncultured Mediterranean phage uvDeep-CGR2-KM21-C368]
MALKTAEDIAILNPQSRTGIGPIGVNLGSGLDTAVKSYTKMSESAKDSFDFFAKLKQEKLRLAALRDVNSVNLTKYEQTTTMFDADGKGTETKIVKGVPYLKPGIYYNDQFNEALENRHMNKVKNEATAFINTVEQQYPFDDEAYSQITSAYIEELKDTDPVTNKVLEDIIIPETIAKGSLIKGRIKDYELTKVIEDESNIIEGYINDEIKLRIGSDRSEETKLKIKELSELNNKRLLDFKKRPYVNGEQVSNLELKMYKERANGMTLNLLRGSSLDEQLQIIEGIKKNEKEVVLKRYDINTGQTDNVTINLEEIFQNIPSHLRDDFRTDLGTKASEIANALNNTKTGYTRKWQEIFSTVLYDNLNDYNMVLGDANATSLQKQQAKDKLINQIQTVVNLTPTFDMTKEEKLAFKENAQKWIEQLPIIDIKTRNDIIQGNVWNMNEAYVDFIRLNPQIIEATHDMFGKALFEDSDPNTQVRMLKEILSDMNSGNSKTEKRMKYLKEILMAKEGTQKLDKIEAGHRVEVGVKFDVIDKEYAQKIKKIQDSTDLSEVAKGAEINNLINERDNKKFEWIRTVGVLPTNDLGMETQNDWVGDLKDVILGSNPELALTTYEEKIKPFLKRDHNVMFEVLRNNIKDHKVLNFWRNYHRIYAHSGDSDQAFKMAEAWANKEWTEDALKSAFDQHNINQWREILDIRIRHYNWKNKQVEFVGYDKDIGDAYTAIRQGIVENEGSLNPRDLPANIFGLIMDDLKTEILTGAHGNTEELIDRSINNILGDYGRAESFMVNRFPDVGLKTKRIKRSGGKGSYIHNLINVENWTVKDKKGKGNHDWLEEAIKESIGNADVESIKEIMQDANPEIYEEMLKETDGDFLKLASKWGKKGNLYLQWDGIDPDNPSYYLIYQPEKKYQKIPMRIRLEHIEGNRAFRLHGLKNKFIKAQEKKTKEELEDISLNILKNNDGTKMITSSIFKDKTLDINLLT